MNHLDSPISEQNIERLVGTAYRPDLPDANFVQNLEEHLLFTAHQLAEERRGEGKGRMGEGEKGRKGEMHDGVSVSPSPVLPFSPSSSTEAVQKRLGWALGLAAAVAVFAIAWYAQWRFDQPELRPGAQPITPRAAADNFEKQPTLERFTTSTTVPRPIVQPAVQVPLGETLITREGERRRVMLADGSVLYLNERTEVKQTASRRLQLVHGEVFLEVAPIAEDDDFDEPAPRATFVVATPQREVSALGTRFAVRADADETGVVVTQGKVKVSGLEEAIEAGQQLSADGKAIEPAPRFSHLLDWIRDLMAAAESPLVPRSKHTGGSLVVVDPNGQEVKLALRKFHIDVHIEDGFARTTIDQTYFNNEWAQLEGTFHFPLPADATLSRLAMYVDQGTQCKLNEGGMAEREYARQVFETIRHTRRDPALLEWVDGSTFKMRVFPLEPRKEKRIILSYTQRLQSSYGVARYRFPAGHSMELVRDWSFAADVKNAGSRRVISTSHPDMKITPQENDVVARAAGKNIKPDRDVMLEISEKGDKTLQKDDQVRFADQVHEGRRYLMLRYRPVLTGAPKAERRDWVFLYESSSNRNPLLARTQIEIIRNLLKNVGHDDTFSILTAGTRVRHFDVEPRRATPKNIDEAAKFLEATHVIGALDLELALRTAAPLLARAKNPHLVHIGAGIPALGERRDDLLVKLLPVSARYVGIGVGKVWNRSLMKQAADRSAGYFTQINPDETIAWRGFDLLATLNTPRLQDIRVESAGLKFLSETSTLAQGEELCAVARAEDAGTAKGKVTVTGKLAGKPFTAELNIANVAGNAGYLPRQWAKLEIDRLLADDADKNKPAIVELSKASYVMSPFTSLLVLETDADYVRINVDRGRKDHWAMYACPDTIPVVHEPGQGWNGQAPVQQVDKSKTREVLESILVRVPPSLTGGASVRAMSVWAICNGPSGSASIDDPAEMIEKLLKDGNVDDGKRPDVKMPGKEWEKSKKLGDKKEMIDPVKPSTLDFPKIETGNEIKRPVGSSNAPPPLPISAPPVPTAPLPPTEPIVSPTFIVPAPVLPPTLMPVPPPGSFPDTTTSKATSSAMSPFGTPVAPGMMMGMSGMGMVGMPVTGTAGMMMNGGGMMSGGTPGMSNGGMSSAYGMPGAGMMGSPMGTPGMMIGMPPAEKTAQRIQFAPVFVSPTMQWALPGNIDWTGYYKNHGYQLYPGNPPAAYAKQTDSRTLDLARLGGFQYQAPVAAVDSYRVFTDLLLHAPALNTNLCDILGVLEAETPLGKNLPRGSIDPAAKKLIDRAREAGWSRLTLGDVSFVVNGAGHYFSERVLPSGLAEQVYCDGKTLLHLYPEIGLGAKRPLTRFHRAELLHQVPWLVLAAEDLVHGADVKLVDEQTVAIVPLSTNPAEKSARKWHLTFTDKGTLSERRLIEGQHTILYRESYDGQGNIEYQAGDDKTSHKLKVAAGIAPKLRPDTAKLVIVPMPLRTREHLVGNVPIESAKLDADLAIRLIVAATLQGRQNEALEIFLNRFFNSKVSDRRLGFYTLLVAAQDPDPAPFSEFMMANRISTVNFDFEAERPNSPLSRYISRCNRNLGRGFREEIGRLPGPKDGLLPQLAKLQDVYVHCRVPAAVVLHRTGQIETATVFARSTQSPIMAWTTLEMLLRLEYSHDAKVNDLAVDLKKRFGDPYGLAYSARYEHAHALSQLKGDKKAARSAFQALYLETLQAGVLPRLDARFAEAFAEEDGALAELVRQTASKFTKENCPQANIVLAWQMWQAGRKTLADSVIDAALAHAQESLGKEPASAHVLLSGIEFYQLTGRPAQVESLLKKILANDKLGQANVLAENPTLWRLAAGLAKQRGAIGEFVRFQEKALALEFKNLPPVVNLQVVRQEYGELMGHYQSVAVALGVIDAEQPKKFVAKVMDVADRWRALDPDSTEVCRLTAKILQILGERDLAWDYLTTPVGQRPNESAPWLALAVNLIAEGSLELADRSYAAAFQAEQTNAQILWDRAQNLQQMGRADLALQMYRQIVDGTWQPRFQPIQQQARQFVTSP